MFTTQKANRVVAKITSTTVSHAHVRKNTLFSGFAPVNDETLTRFLVRVSSNGEPGGDLLSHTRCALSSAQLRFTVLFEMGRGGSEALLPPSITCSQSPWRLRKIGRR